MNVLVACECSGRVKTAFRNRGHNAWSCDIKPSEIPDDKYHLKGDAIYYSTHGDWDLLIAHPDCTYLAVSGARWWETRCLEQRQAIEFVMFFANLPIRRIAIENPIGKLSTAWRKPDQIIQPWMFGEDASKATCLWLKGLPLLKATKLINPHYRCRCGYRFEYELGKYGCPNCCGDKTAKLVFGNQTPSGQNNEPPGINQKANRARTYQGIANAMAEQWGVTT